MLTRNAGAAPRDEATYSLMPGMPELSGIREQLNSLVDELSHKSQNAMTAEPLAVAVPLYIYPDEGCWDALYQAMEKFSATEFHVVINPANGPGRRVPDPNYVREVARLNTFHNCRIFGYVHVSWGKRKLSLVKGDVTTWAHWTDYKKANIRVHGIFIDESPSSLDLLDYARDVYHHVKDELGQEALVWTNPGVEVDGQFHEVADLVNAHENSHEAWKQNHSNSKAKSTAMVHSYDGSLEEMQEDLDRLKAAGYRSVLITSGNSYTSFSPFFDLFVSSVTQLNSVKQW